MKKLIKTVTLNFLQDDATGEYGLTHADTCRNNYGNGFNAFWNGTGIFHDVFEHNHEFSKYFMGDNALNVGGEMAAMGAMWYYYDILNVSNRPLSTYHAMQDSMRVTTESMIQDAIYSGYCQYGDILNSGVPMQSPVDNGELEYQITKMTTNVKSFKYQHSKGHEYYSEDEKDYADTYKRSVTFRKIADLHRYGYRMAERLVPDTGVNMNVLYDFIEMFNYFCKNNNAEDMNNNFESMIFKIYRDKGTISYTATLISRYGSELPDIKIKSGNTIYMENYYTYAE